MKKLKRLSLSLSLIFYPFLVSGAYAQENAISPNVDAARDIVVERAGDSSIISVQVDAAASSEPSLSEISLTGKLNQSGKLKSLTVRFCADSTFVPSGEAEIIVSGEMKLTLYSSSVQKVSEQEKTNYTLTFLNNLDAVVTESGLISESVVFLKVYSKKNKAARLGVPCAFFKFLGSLPR